MTGREFLNAPGMRYALAVFAGAALTVGWVGLQAYQVQASEAPPRPAALSLAGIEPPPGVIPIDVASVVEADVFSEDRAAPAKRYRLPGEVDPVAPPAPTAATKAPAREPPRPSVSGAVISTDTTRSFITAQMGSAPAVKLRLGQKIGDFTLVAIAMRKVTFVNGAGATIEVNVNR